MLQSICPCLCPIPFCEVICPLKVISSDEKMVYLDLDNCVDCGLCRFACANLSASKTLQRRRFGVKFAERE